MRTISLLLLAACGGNECPTTSAPESVGAIHRGDKPLTLVGKTLQVGDALPTDVTVVDGKLAAIDFAALKGKVIVFSVVPSIDTRVCETQTHKISDAIASPGSAGARSDAERRGDVIDRYPPGTEVFTVSRDLPFAQTRFAEEAVVRTKMASDYNSRTFGRAFGVEVKETGLLARSVWVIGKDGKVVYRELVDDQGTEPNYDALLEAVKKAGG